MFSFQTTDDGSTTVRILSGEETSEAMHSLRGAFSETLYIYGTAIETMLAQGFPPRVLSMGLGLGYVEILAAGLFIRAGQFQTSGGESFELVPRLREAFSTWATGNGANDEELAPVYESVLQRTSDHLKVSASETKALLKAMLEDGRWILHEALTPETRFKSRFGCICFDAFSSKTTPTVWSEEFLTNFLAQAPEPKCVLSTYACTGALKRSLRAAGFELQIREGFSSKRDSTFAVRNIS